MTVLYPNLCYNEVCYKGTEMYIPSKSRRIVLCHVMSQPM